MLRAGDRFFGFWRVLIGDPLVGLIFVLATQLAPIACAQRVSGMCFGTMGLLACAAAWAGQHLASKKRGT